VDHERRTIWKRIADALDSVVRVAHPEAAAGSPGATLRNVLVAVLVVSVGTLVAFGWEWVTAESKVRQEAEIIERIAAEKAQEEREAQAGTETEPAPDDPGDAGQRTGEDPEQGAPEGEDVTAEKPFDPGIWSVVEAVEPIYPGPGILVLDGLDDESVAMFRSAEYDEAGFGEVLDRVWAEGAAVHSTFGQDPGLSNRWKVTLNSTGPTAVTVTDLRLADLECVPARATAAFHLPEQGSDDRLLVSYSMERPSVGRLYEYTDAGDHGPSWGEPFFDHKVVNLGGGGEGVGLTVEVVTTTEDCTWSSFELTYQGPEGPGVHEVASEDGEPFEARGIAADADTFSMYERDDGPDVWADPLW
jgi:hypothetical protein